MSRHHHHEHEHGHGHGHSHGMVDPSIVRSRQGVKAVSWSFLVLFVTALIQLVVYLSASSVALLADLVHNLGDAMTAIPLGLAFLLRSKKGEKYAGYFVVFVIFASAAIAAYEVTDRFIHPQEISNVWVVLVAGLVGVAGNEIAAVIRWRAGKKLNSPALIADGNHARADGLVSAGVVVSAILVSFGFPIADPIVGLIITLMIVRITWQSWRTIREHD